MKIYITQGHELGIGLEVFFKAITFLSKDNLAKLELLAFKSSVIQTLNHLNIPHQISANTIIFPGKRILSVQWLNQTDHSESFTALKLGMDLAEQGGILYTLPTSKDQFPQHAGHTEYFRDFYRRPELGMFFSAPDLKVLLLSDHIALKDVASSMTEKLIYTRLKQALTTFESWQWPIEQVLIAGINPHAGESGLIGREDEQITKAITKLRQSFKLPIKGPIAGDTMHLLQASKNDLLVYIYHDQGLGIFKALQGFIGSNITLGLPYPRFSPDHGTSFQLYGKNQADYRGCLYSINEALALLKRLAHG